VSSARTDDGRPLLSLAGVTKTYPGVAALAGLSFAVAPGETVALLGPSGCGKSTALRLIAGLEAQSAGAITWPALDREAPQPGEIGFVFQEPTLLPWGNVAENIALPLRLLHRPHREAREIVRSLIDEVGLTGFSAALPRALSGGMKMRVSLARALASRPSILLLDEPFGALDEITRQNLNDALLELKAERPLTILFVTHSVFESVYLANRVLVFSPRPGRIVRELMIEAPESRAGFRFTAAYSEQCREVSAALAAVMEARHAA
jgi:NitT/TauT family transport system ATP-binding protein